jgi:predicted nucleic acid-binding Zn ribbon protein
MIPVHSLMPDLLVELLRRQPLSPAKVAFAWRTAVGPALDRATHVSLRDDGVLEVVASDTHWKR